MPSRVDPAVVEALRMHQPTGVRADDVKDLQTKRDRKSAINKMRRAWGSEAARSLEALQEAQIELGRLLSTGSAEAFQQRDVVIERRRALDREIEASRSSVKADAATGTGRHVLSRFFGG
ncbi:MAG: hypothetical protein ACLFRT_12045 [Actinomycetota bacterium]